MTALTGPEIEEWFEKGEKWEAFQNSLSPADIERTILTSNDWDVLKTYIYIVSNADHVYSQAVHDRLFELALLHRDDDPDIENSDEISNKSAVFNAIMRIMYSGGMRSIFKWWTFLEPGHRIETSRFTMMKIERMLEAHPAQNAEEYSWLAHNLASVLEQTIILNPFPLDDRASFPEVNLMVYVQTAVKCIALTGCELAHILILQVLSQYDVTRKYMKLACNVHDLKDTHDEWNKLFLDKDERKPCWETLVNLNRTITSLETYPTQPDDFE